MNAERTLNVGAELRDAEARLGEALKRLAVFAAIAERLGKLPEGADLPSADIVMHFGGLSHVAPNEQRRESKEVRENFAAYCARFAVVGMITACEEFLQRILFIVRLGEFAAKSGATLTGEQFIQTREKTRKEVRRLSVDGLPMQILAAIHRNSVPLPELDWFRGVYSIRKCLVHRNGVIGEDDVDEHGIASAKWRKAAMQIGDKEIAALPIPVQAGDVLSVQFVDSVRTWQLGDSVILTAQECQEVALTLSTFCSRMSLLAGQGVAELVKGRG